MIFFRITWLRSIQIFQVPVLHSAAVWSSILLALFSCVHLNECIRNFCTWSSEILISLSSVIVVRACSNHTNLKVSTAIC
jgi:hypothetical protein